MFESSTLIQAQSKTNDTATVDAADRLYAAEKYHEAIKEYEKLPVSADILKKIGISYHKLWEMPAAIRSLRKARQLAQEDIEIKSHLAEALSWNKEFEEAIILYQDVFSKGFVNVDVQFEYARVLAWVKDYDSAINLYRQILEKDSINFQARMGLAQTLSWRKDFDGAVEEYRKAAIFTMDLKEKSQAITRLAQVISWTGAFDNAVVEYKEALQFHSNNTDALYGLGEVNEWMGQFPKAKSYYDQILQIEPGNKSAKAKLLQLLWVK